MTVGEETAPLCGIMEDPMIALTASFALALIAAPQETCGSYDTACRIRQLERRVEALERQLAGQPRSAGIEMAVDFGCSNTADCIRKARAVCEQAGFPRGAPTDRQPSSVWAYRVSRVACG